MRRGLQEALTKIDSIISKNKAPTSSGGTAPATSGGGSENSIIPQYLIYIGKPKLSMSENIDELNLNFRYNIIDMHSIDCEEFIRLDTPEALVLSILCDFKGRDKLDILIYITRRLEELAKDSEHRFGKYMLILETLFQTIYRGCS